MLLKAQLRVEQDTKISELCEMAKPSNHSETFSNSLWSRFEPMIISSVFQVLCCRKFCDIQLFTAAIQDSSFWIWAVSLGSLPWFYRNKELGVIRVAVETNSEAAYNVAQGKHVDCKKQWTKDRPLWYTKA